MSAPSIFQILGRRPEGPCRREGRRRMVTATSLPRSLIHTETRRTIVRALIFERTGNAFLFDYFATRNTCLRAYLRTKPACRRGGTKRGELRADAGVPSAGFLGWKMGCGLGQEPRPRCRRETARRLCGYGKMGRRTRR